MSLIYITGIAGAGKSTLLDKLKKSGYEVHDADENLSYWANKQSGEKVSKSDHRLTTDPGFFETHDWYIDRESIEKLALKSENNAVYICGSVANEQEVWNFFDKVYCLYVDDETLIRRIQNRTDKDFGKAEHELKHLLELNQQVVDKYTALGAVILNATQPLEMLYAEVTTQRKKS